MHDSQQLNLASSHAMLCLKRRGVTIIEVLFASGIAVFGLVGIASLLAVAGRQASDANNWSEGQAAAQFALSDFSIRGYNNSASWRFYNDQRPSGRFVNYVGLPSLTRATSVGGVRTDNRYAVCIDPYFFSDPNTVTNLNNTFDSAQRYRPGLFPYYQDDFNPHLPSTPLTANAGRLLRVSVQQATNGLLSSKAIDRQFQILDDLAVTANDQDTTLPAERVLSFLPSGAAQALTQGQWSWFATLCPRELTPSELSDTSLPKTNFPENLFTLSIVVCKTRDRTFFLPTTGQQGPQGERVVTVTPPLFPYRFSGGGGGRVTFSAAHNDADPQQTISDSLGVGDWVMLCREQPILGTPHVATVCRWYRVMTLDLEAVINTANNTWSRTVVLDGPDWDFDATYPTQATLVSGVVTVAERAIRVQ